jgi:hypothetical protein
MMGPSGSRHASGRDINFPYDACPDSQAVGVIRSVGRVLSGGSKNGAARERRR